MLALTGARLASFWPFEIKDHLNSLLTCAGSLAFEMAIAFYQRSKH
jgi:hypothetical protein